MSWSSSEKWRAINEHGVRAQSRFLLPQRPPPSSMDLLSYSSHRPNIVSSKFRPDGAGASAVMRIGCLQDGASSRRMVSQRESRLELPDERCILSKPVTWTGNVGRLSAYVFTRGQFIAVVVRESAVFFFFFLLRLPSSVCSSLSSYFLPPLRLHRSEYHLRFRFANLAGPGSGHCRSR